MPRQFTAYEPDAIDVNTLVTAVHQDFGLLVHITTVYARDLVTTIVKCTTVAEERDQEVIVQAVVSRPLKGGKSLYVAHYSAVLDCWHQLDRGVLAAASRPIERGWDGRPRTPRRR